MQGSLVSLCTIWYCGDAGANRMGSMTELGIFDYPPFCCGRKTAIIVEGGYMVEGGTGEGKVHIPLVSERVVSH